MSKVKTDELDQWHDYSIYTPARLIELAGDIDEDSASEFIKNIRLLDHVTDQDITILLSTGGGCVTSGMQIFDAIKECNSKVIIHAVGPCWSMGSVILQAGDVRRISANATVMLHLGTSEYPENHVMIQKRWIDEHERIEAVTQKILLKKIKTKKPRFTKKQLHDMLVFDTILTADKTLEFGLADEIAQHKEF